MTQLWRLEITTFKGMAINAEHYYAKLASPSIQYEVMKILDAKEARVLREKDGYLWHAGSLSNKFNTEPDLIQAALVAWSSVADERDLLVQAGFSSAEPGVPVGGPPDLMATVKSLYDRMEATGLYEGNARLYRETLLEWDAFLRTEGIAVRTYQAREDGGMIAMRRNNDGWEVVEEGDW